MPVALLDQLHATRDATLAHFNTSATALDHSYAPGKWSVRYFLHHLADAETVLFDRIRRVISNPGQVIWGFNQDAWATGLGYDTRPLALSRALYEATRAGIIYYAERHYIQDGHLPFVHSETGSRTLIIFQRPYRKVDK